MQNINISYSTIVSFASTLGWPIPSRTLHISVRLMASYEYFFARSFVKCVFAHLTGTEYPEKVKFDVKPPIVLFDETFARAIHNLSRQHGSEYRKCFLGTSGTPYHRLWKHVFLLWNHFLAGGFDPERLLHFCMYVSTMAVYFYRHGVEDSPDKAVYSILHRLVAFDLSQDMWRRLYGTAEFYATLTTGFDCEPESPVTEDSVVPQKRDPEECDGKNAECQIVYRFSRILRGHKSDGGDRDVPVSLVLKKERSPNSDGFRRKGYKLKPCLVHNGVTRARQISAYDVI